MTATTKTSKEPTLAVFDIDGTLAEIGPRTEEEGYPVDYLLGLPSYSNMIGIVRSYLKKRNVSVMFCTGRPASTHGTTRRWLNSKLDLSQAPNRVTLVCRPDDTPASGIPAFKLAEILQAIRRLGSRPAEAVIYDDDVNNLRLFGALKPMVRKLSIFKVDEGMISEWSL